MVKLVIKGMVWRLADSEHMPIRRFGWRLLELFRGLTEKPEVADLGDINDGSASIREADRTYLKQLYDQCTVSRPLDTGGGYVGIHSSSVISSCQLGPEVAKKNGAIVVLAPSLPKYDRSSSGLRVAQLVKTLSQFVESLSFLYTAKSEFDPIFRRFLPDTVKYCRVAETPQGLSDCLITLIPDVLIITDLFDQDFIALCSEVIDRIKRDIPTCKVVLDTMDCHWKKYVRKALVSDNPADWRNSLSYMELERTVYPKVDLLTVVSDPDGKDIVLSIPGISGYLVLPNCYELGDSLPSFDATHGVCFVGAATVNHNLDGMRYFRDKIYPHLKGLVPELSVNVIGPGWEKVCGEFAGYPFRFLGHVPDLDSVLSQSRVFICPLVYGAGMKGKLGSAASAGIPVVTTSIGSEGYPVRNTEDFIVADDPVEFAEACALLISESEVWERTRDNFRSMIQSFYGSDSLRPVISQMMQCLRSNQ